MKIFFSSHLFIEWEKSIGPVLTRKWAKYGQTRPVYLKQYQNKINWKIFITDFQEELRKLSYIFLNRIRMIKKSIFRLLMNLKLPYALFLHLAVPIFKLIF